MEEQKYSVKTRARIYSALAWAGVIVAVIGYFLTGVPKQILPWVGLAMVVGAVIYRFTMIKCPHCGNMLTESKRIPDHCPECHQELN